MFKNVIFLFMSFLVCVGCASRKECRYRETIATIEDERVAGKSGSLLATSLVNSPIINTNHVTWSSYSFSVNGKKYWGEGYSEYGIGEKFVVRYDTIKPGNDHHYLVYYKPVFLASEQTNATTGKITKVHGKDVFNKGAVAAEFEYDVVVNNVKTHYKKYQYFSPEIKADSLKQHPEKAYQVLYSLENPQRAILYLDHQ